MNRKWLAAVSATVFPLVTAMYFAGKSVVASANSAPPYWEGTDASGAVVKGENCPVVVEKETLSLNIGSLPRQGQGTLELGSYAAEAVTEYCFYNPTDLDVDMTLLFPFGVFPSYVPDGADDEISAVTVNGENAKCNVRYSYASYQFDTDRDMARILEDKKEDSFYREELPVTQYSVSAFAPDGVDCCIKIKLCYNAKKTRVLFPAESHTRLSVSGGDMYACTPVEGGEQTAVFYAVGEPLDEAVSKLYGGNEAIASLSEPTRRQTTFSRFVFENRERENAAGDTDWYNAFVDMLNERGGANGAVDSFSLNAKNLMRWYEYDMRIPAGGRAVNRVRAPLYPTVEGNKNPRYEYSYLLSPAGKWADFHGIEIRIDTPFYLSNGSLDFTRAKNENGQGYHYVYTRNSLPLGELTFVLTEKETADSDFNVYGNNFLHPPVTWAFVTLTVLAVVAAVVTVIVVVSLRKKKKK